MVGLQPTIGGAFAALISPPAILCRPFGARREFFAVGFLFFAVGFLFLAVGFLF